MAVYQMVKKFNDAFRLDTTGLSQVDRRTDRNPASILRVTTLTRDKKILARNT